MLKPRGFNFFSAAKKLTKNADSFTFFSAAKKLTKNAATT
jgi:hypothetical protein